MGKRKRQERERESFFSWLTRDRTNSNPYGWVDDPPNEQRWWWGRNARRKTGELYLVMIGIALGVLLLDRILGFMGGL